jgi:RNA polymerase sigma-70 factor (ECF subfamily)
MGRADRFDELYRKNYAAVVRYARRRADPDTVGDVVAETFLIAWRRLDFVPADAAAAQAWLYGVARRVLANIERSRRRADRVALRLGQQSRAEHMPDTAGSVAERARMAQALAALSSSDQEVLRLIGWEELDLAGAAIAMGCSRSTMTVRLHRARRRLEKALGAIDNDETGLALNQPALVQRIRQETQ